MAIPTTADAPAATPAPFVPAAERGLLVVLPHPDDETFSSGGTMARCADAGVPVTYLCGTYGDMGRRMGRPAFANRESLRDIRERELADACAVLGAEVRMLGLRDKCVEFEDPIEVAERVRAVIEELDPSTVVGFYPGYAVHADHDALGLIVQLAVRALPAGRRPRLLAVAVGDQEANRATLGEPDVLSDIAHTVDRKIAALRAHRSQTEAMFVKWDEDAEDEQGKAFRDRLLGGERFYLLDPHHVTGYERNRP
ncbi:MAG: bacillithiol biosynthesis deacetylase BshB2 [Trueperaceae bacterium]